MKKSFESTFWVLLIAMLMMTGYASILNSVKGTVTDAETGEVLPGVKITITIESLIYETSTNDEGYFFKSGLKTGSYKVKFEKDGYIPAVTGFYLSIDERRDTSIQLKKLKVENVIPEGVLLMKKAVQQINTGKYKEAIDILGQAVDKDGKNPMLFYYRGFSHDKLGDTESALSDFKRSLELDPELLLSLAEVGKIYAKKRDMEEAVKYYKKAYELGIKDNQALYNYGICLVSLANNEEALKVFQKLVEVDNAYPDSYYQLGLIYLGLGDNAKSKDYLTKFLEMAPEHKDAPVAKEILKTL